MKDTGGSAFPWTYYDRDSLGQIIPREHIEGMTLRDYFAAKALIGLVLSRQLPNASESANTETIAECAYSYADAMLKEREGK